MNFKIEFIIFVFTNIDSLFHFIIYLFIKKTFNLALIKSYI